MQPEEAANVKFDPFDVTKIWPRGKGARFGEADSMTALFPMQEVGELELNRNPEDYHRDVEQAAFSPGSLVPGIELSPDTLLDWRAFLWVRYPQRLAYLTPGKLPRCAVPSPSEWEYPSGE